MQRRQTVSFVDEKGGRLRGRGGKQVNMPSEEQRRERDRGSRGGGASQEEMEAGKGVGCCAGLKEGPSGLGLLVTGDLAQSEDSFIVALTGTAF